jgi:hypothetical protein
LLTPQKAIAETVSKKSEPEKGLLGRYLNVVLFAPVGIATHAITHFDELIEEGRSTLLGSLGAARNLGKVAGQAGSKAAASAMGQTAPARPPVAKGALDHLIPGYDQLSASQVLRRLETLSDAELHEISACEAQGRGRQTILAAIAQRLEATTGDAKASDETSGQSS